LVYPPYTAGFVLLSSFAIWAIKKDIQQHQAISTEQKESVAMRKKNIQRRFREELSLLVDAPKVGFGNSNTGNTARRAFENSAEFSNITGVNEEIIIRLRNILKAVNSGYHIDIEAFKTYALKTSEIIVDMYGWYNMPPSVHKLLEHGHVIIEKFELPIGQYSEEAQEAQNKELRNARLNHTCKISRLNVMKNQFHHLLIRTDPVISSISFINHKSYMGKPLEDEVKSLLKN